MTYTQIPNPEFSKTDNSFKKIDQSIDAKPISGSLFFVIHKDDCCELGSYSILNKYTEDKCHSYFHTSELKDNKNIVATFYDSNNNELDQYLEFDNNVEYTPEYIRPYKVAEKYLDHAIKLKVVKVEVAPLSVKGIFMHFIIKLGTKYVANTIHKWSGEYTKEAVMRYLNRTKQYYQAYDLSSITTNDIYIEEPSKNICVIL